MSFFDLRQKIGSKTRKADMEGFFSSTSEKILQTIFSVWDDEEQILRKMPLFSEFVVNFRKEEISLRLNNCFRAYLYQIPERVQFNRYELSAFLQMRSKYSKTLFRYLLQKVYRFVIERQQTLSSEDVLVADMKIGPRQGDQFTLPQAA